jgi:ABC-type amino acid transport substrate-binding protein
MPVDETVCLGFQSALGDGGELDFQSAQPLQSMSKCVGGWHGLTFDFLNAVTGKVRVGWSWVDPKHLGTPVPGQLVSVVPLPGNEEIFAAIRSSHCDATLHPFRLCIGAAAISMTPDREKTMDFLPTYFHAGLQVMTKLEDSVWERAWKIVGLLFQLLGGILAVLVSVILVISPIVWFLETALSRDDVSCFHISDAELMQKGAWRKTNKDGSVGNKDELSSFMRMLMGMYMAFEWTAIGFFGGEVGRPTSLPAIGIKIAAKGLSRLVLISIVAGMTTVLTLGTQLTAISELRDIAGNSVCVVKDSVASKFLEDHRDIGFRVKEANTITEMYEDFWVGPSVAAGPSCEVVVYDFSILRHQINERAKKCDRPEFKDAPYCDSNAASLVGEVLTKDPYGMVRVWLRTHGPSYFWKLIAQSCIVSDTQIANTFRYNPNCD